VHVCVRVCVCVCVSVCVCTWGDTIALHSALPPRSPRSDTALLTAHFVFRVSCFVFRVSCFVLSALVRCEERRWLQGARQGAQAQASPPRVTVLRVLRLLRARQAASQSSRGRHSTRAVDHAATVHSEQEHCAHARDSVGKGSGET
jgi:hypothetical protein